MIWVDYFALIAGILLALVVLLMHSQDDIKDAFSGEKSELFKNRKTRGLELFLNRSAAVLAVVLIVAVLLSNNLR
ncbi:MAG TPA: preprotein translocase subunit SecG [Acholeplasmataceae bacterium]|jgi:preprotein translocase subunit SecG|nr:MAG: preprotein translocase subunit SecG [Tenericutes bacterium GWA2_38_26]OHE30616.1 MAG: preprotein translocase subunit SecG [Tenericutes bacterium GWC2_39_45]OHE35205.1 MAG: preprotein translocase subunit SecG [Tenericutes bacterium GWE2_38_8]OHE42419.1 MAG: preprotein translocase subunit SecG [Tenericutes bacterium GWF2_38_8]HBG32630.1 preprotein translocase subunit SecG [Acholeplasmataceae bacterium]